MDDTVFIGYGGGLVAMMRSGKVWGAPTPEELIAKLDAEGIDRKRLYLIVPDDLVCPDCQRRLNSDPLWPVIADWNLTHPGPFKWCPAAGWFRPFSCP